MALGVPAAVGLNTSETVQVLPAARGNPLQPSAVTTNWGSVTAIVMAPVSLWPGLVIVRPQPGTGCTDCDASEVYRIPVMLKEPGASRCHSPSPPRRSRAR